MSNTKYLLRRHKYDKSLKASQKQIHKQTTLREKKVYPSVIQLVKLNKTSNSKDKYTSQEATQSAKK